MSTRRQFLKLSGSALAMIPVLAASTNAFAAKNDAMRKGLAYQDKPAPDGHKCATCNSFVKPSGCQMMAGDTEISENGWCKGWNPKK